MDHRNEQRRPRWKRPADDDNTVIDSAEAGVFVPVGVVGGPNGANFNLGVGAVPEPSTYFLGMVGGVALLGAMRLRRTRAVTVTVS